MFNILNSSFIVALEVQIKASSRLLEPHLTTFAIEYDGVFISAAVERLFINGMNHLAQPAYFWMCLSSSSVLKTGLTR